MNFYHFNSLSWSISDLNYDYCYSYLWGLNLIS